MQLKLLPLGFEMAKVSCVCVLRVLYVHSMSMDGNCDFHFESSHVSDTLVLHS